MLSWGRRYLRNCTPAGVAKGEPAVSAVWFGVVSSAVQAAEAPSAAALSPGIMALTLCNVHIPLERLLCGPARPPAKG